MKELESKISLQMYTMRDYTGDMPTLAKTLERLSKIGFKTLQYSLPDSMDAKEVASLFDAYGLRNDSVFCPSPLLEERAEKVLRMCEIFGTDYVRLSSMPGGELTFDASGYKMYAHYLNEAGQIFKQNGKKLLYHFHAFEFIRFGETSGIEILISETNPDTVQLIPDTHWIHAGGKNCASFLEKHNDRYDYVHFKDFAITRRGPQLEQRPIIFAPVGEGNLDWKPIFDVCKKNGVKSFAIEQDDCYGRDPFDCVASSFNFMKQLGVDD